MAVCDFLHKVNALTFGESDDGLLPMIGASSISALSAAFFAGDVQGANTDDGLAENFLNSLLDLNLVGLAVNLKDVLVVLLTEQGLRLIDVGISALREEVNDKIFDKFVETEQQEILLFKEYFLNR